MPTRLFRARHRGAAAMQYAMIIGLIAVFALVAIANLGSTGRALFAKVANRLENVQGGGSESSTGSGPAATQPNPPCANNSTPVLSRGGVPHYVGVGARSFPLPPRALTSCPAPGTWDSATSFQSYDGTNTYIAIRYETADATSSTTVSGTTRNTFNCADAGCTSVGSNIAITQADSVSYISNVPLCTVSFFSQSNNGNLAYYYPTAAGSPRIIFYHQFGGVGANTQTTNVSSYMYMQYKSPQSGFPTIYAPTNKVWIEAAAP